MARVLGFRVLGFGCDQLIGLRGRSDETVSLAGNDLDQLLQFRRFRDLWFGV
jgi:hypothetical protein